MDYNNIFENYSKCKKIVSKLIQSRDLEFIKGELEKIKDYDLKKVIKSQYLYLYQKQLNLLEGNKTVKIVMLEEKLRLFNSKNKTNKVKMLDRLGYIDILLLLLNLPKSVIDELRESLKIKKNHYDEIDLTVLDLDNSQNNKKINDIIERTAERVSETLLEQLNKSGTNVNIKFNNDGTVQNKVITSRQTDDDNDDDNDDDDDDDETHNQANIENRIKLTAKLAPELIPRKKIVEQSIVEQKIKDGDDKTKNPEDVLQLSTKDIEWINKLG